MRGNLQFDLQRDLGARGFSGITDGIAGLAAMAMLALAAPAFAQASGDGYDATAASATTADAASASATYASVAGSADAGSDTFAPAAGAAIIAPDSGYALPPPDDGSLADPASSPGDAVAADGAIEPDPAVDGAPGDGAPNSLPPIDLSSSLGGIAPVAAADEDSSSGSHSGWDRVGDSESGTGGDGSAGNSVLEVPQATPSPGSDASQAAQGGDSAPPDQVGSVDEYQDEQDYYWPIYIGPPTGPPLLNPPFAASTFGNHSNANVSAQPGVGPMLPGVGGVRPFAGGMNSAIMPTSPMFPRNMMVRSYRPTAPRSSAPIPGGWWNRAR
jgi:hypothetical protein